MYEGIKGNRRGPDTQVRGDGTFTRTRWSWESQKSFRKEDSFLWAFSQGLGSGSQVWLNPGLDPKVS